MRGAGVPARFAVTFRARLRGLLGKQPDESLLVIAPCHAIHTFGMRGAIDVAFIDGNGIVAAVERGLPPGRYRRNARAVAVIERFASPTPFFIPDTAVMIDPELKSVDLCERSPR